MGPQYASKLLLNRVNVTQTSSTEFKVNFHDKSLQKPVLCELGLINMFSVIWAGGVFTLVLVFVCFGFFLVLFCYFKLNLSIVLIAEKH